MVPAFLKPPASSFSSSNRIDRCSRKRFFLRPSRSPSLPFCFRQRLAYRSGAHTPAGAVFRNRILLKMSGSALSLSFHIRLNERCALTYPLRSALPIPPFPVVLKTPTDSALHRKKDFRLLWPLLTSVRSALSLNNGYSFRSVPHRSPWVPHVSFPPSICRIYCTWFRTAIGLYLVWQTYPHVQPSMRFLFVRPEVCPWGSRFPTSGFLQIQPHGGHPCLRLYPSLCRVDLGLAPFRNVCRQAHHHRIRGCKKTALKGTTVHQKGRTVVPFSKNTDSQINNFLFACNK